MQPGLFGVVLFRSADPLLRPGAARMWHLSPTVAVTPGGGGPVGEVGDAATVELEEWEMKVHVLGGVSLEQNRP